MKINSSNLLYLVISKIGYYNSSFGYVETFMILEM
jgi:hypothetical protein